MTGLRFKRLLLTGAAGTVGRMLLPRMKYYRETLRVSDVAAMAPAGDGEEVVVAPLEDETAMYGLLGARCWPRVASPNPRSLPSAR